MAWLSAKPADRAMVVGMLTDQQIETYRRDGYLVIPRLIQGEPLSDVRAPPPRPHRCRSARRYGERRSLRPGGQPQCHAATRAPAEARDLQALHLLPRAGARSQDHVDPGAAPGASHSPAWRQAQHEVG